MADRPDDDLPAGYASPPCFMHELDPAWLGLPAAPEDAQQRRDVARWRKAERQRLIAARMALDPSLRRHWCDRIAAHLDASLGPLDGLTVSGWWPIRAEPDLRTWADTLPDRGASYALPVVAEKGRPLVFRRWRRGDRLEPGVWNIPTRSTAPRSSPTSCWPRSSASTAPAGGWAMAAAISTARWPFCQPVARLWASASACSRSRRSIRSRTTSRWG